MTSEAKILANRVNARASTGPRTAAGKATAARNARRHGLSLPVVADRTFQPELEAMARSLAGETAGAERYELALQIAAAQMDLVRVRSARHDLLSRSLPSSDQLVERPESAEWHVSAPQDHVENAGLVSDLSKLLARLDRYERRALSRRKFAIRDFDAAE